jgi:enamine deaminase RidA (YjgF/YER057c/UK114 family)
VRKQIIRTPDALNSSLFSQAVKVGPTIYMSGIAAIDPKTNQLVGPIHRRARSPGSGPEVPNLLVSIKMTAVLGD